MLEQFGWIKAAYATQVPDGKVANIESVERTDFGDAMFATLGGISSFGDRNTTLVQQELKPLFPNWKNSLLPEEQPFREGRYQLKLSWGKVWRRLETPANISLEDITGLLLDSFEFDQDTCSLVQPPQKQTQRRSRVLRKIVVFETT